MNGERFDPGTEVIWRSRPGGEVGFVLAGRVLLDGSEVRAIVQPSGGHVARGIGRRGGPRGRSMLPGGWAGIHEVTTWALKDEDELDWSLEVGKISAEDHAAAHHAAATAIADLEARVWQFDEAAWPPLPDALLEPVRLPEGWASLDWQRR